MTDIRTALEVEMIQLQEFRKEQFVVNKALLEGQQRMELLLSKAVNSSCAAGACSSLKVELDSLKSISDLKFIDVYKRLDQKGCRITNLEKKLDDLKSVVNRGLGAIAVLIVIIHILSPVLLKFIKL